MQKLDEDGERLIDVARSLRPTLERCRQETERARLLAPDAVEAFREANLFRLAAPREEGGLQASPLLALRLYEELASCEASAAWLVWNSTLPQLMARFLAADVRRALLDDPHCLMASSTRPSGRAVRSGDGFRLSGRWTLVSGCQLATHVLLRAVVTDAHGESRASAAPRFTMLYVPRGSYQIVDTWHAGGLRGTGSHDVVVDDLLVPGTHAVWFDDPVTLHAPLYRMPFAATLSAGCAAICLGLADTALRTLLQLARNKVAVDTGAKLADQPALQLHLARLHAERTAARLALHHLVSEVWIKVVAGERIALEQRAGLWATAHHAAAAARRIVRCAHQCAGTAALYEDCPLERAHRDIHAATQHIILNELWLQDVGRVLLDAEPAHPLFAS